ncbi:hypothetical protein L1987_53193 [Smallanthus sonchifolius]|uniref:Uncharacterized protein n=1 Tax=Smallanthus sonchifolius TaxID=185202 RepID=A0ACB9EV79_9ASTR|nr:hypothetical protein L1987_53193 [Smallanthus sonchifolius]
MRWRRLAKSLQAFSSHTALFCFTLLLLLKLDHHIFSSWWIVFFPLFVFHLIVARVRFSLPAPSAPHNRHIIEVFIKVPAVSLKIVFLPLLAFEITILVDNNVQGSTTGK